MKTTYFVPAGTKIRRFTVNRHYTMFVTTKPVTYTDEDRTSGQSPANFYFTLPVAAAPYTKIGVPKASISIFKQP